MGSRDLLSEFWDPLHISGLSREWWKLETSNLAHTLATGGPNEKNTKGVVKGSRDLLFETLGPTPYLGNSYYYYYY